ncbi:MULTISPECIES: hypothetical protein [Mycobacterium]|uniref:Uncharacterized protein n=1 Tax=Mycobacterium kiyosense TaxID=2871094 RepID=A0A9P3V0U0_9MYCO|nr:MULTISPECIES: hypothetical protein [Mycobacterium]BDB44606.1 hypothetical protein IWGMT90018_50520 [Mycobacterium kiyosense]BDE16108.1 hypothetical protein MKCMC460_49680 [Mycobacterium sp. 20KCMC460]GLB86185.1 hypothetical protein SRL2020028_54410 [Mycobacterium kiyosense]GLB92757.1 hypothetical protein SRL2020130_55740 [Mycobacterium kiyosense]GLB98743.1 hypothetical protein SRL2020226_55190 [Mycobacterium kiyosense]
MNHLLLTVIAAGGTRNNGPDFGKASPLGLLIVVLLVVATVFLVRSMNRQLRKVPPSFDPQHPEPDQAADEGTDAVDADGPGPPEGDGSARPSGSAHDPG